MPDFDPKTWELLKAMLLMAVLLVIVALGIQLIAVYRRRMTARLADSREEQAEMFRDAYEAGEIDTEEYRQIQDALDRGHEPPAVRIARLPHEHSSPSVGPDEQTELDTRDAEDAPAPEPSPEGGTAEPDLPRSG